MANFSNKFQHLGATLGSVITAIGSSIDWAGLPNMMVYALCGGIVGGIAHRITSRIMGDNPQKKE